MRTCVWAFQPLRELNNELGYVECEEALAETLIKAGRAQDPRVGATALNYIDASLREPGERAQEYDDKEMTPKRPRHGHR
jgi:hypothetical protein